NEDLDGTELGADPLERGVDRTAIGDVHLDGDGAHLAGFLLRRRAVQVQDRDLVPVGDELTGDAQPDAGGATGDDGDAIHRVPSTGSNSRYSLVRPRRIQVGS